MCTEVALLDRGRIVRAEANARVPGAVQHGRACARWCTADPGPFQAIRFGTVPVLHSSTSCCSAPGTRELSRPTVAQIEFPLCGIYTFDNDDRLAGEKIYYDRATLLRQLGVFHEPDCAVARITTLLMNPLTMAQVVGRRIWKRN
jgi:hypothetical protein